MNAAEHIVDCYYLIVEQCFTMSDVKVIGGINRQLDILAVNLKTGSLYHVESSVTHRKGWAPKAADLKTIFNKKFLGLPEERSGTKTDYALGKTYKKNIEETYEAYGFEPKKVHRVFVCWILHPKFEADKFLKEFENEHKFKISVNHSEIQFFQNSWRPSAPRTATMRFSEQSASSKSIICKQNTANEPVHLSRARGTSDISPAEQARMPEASGIGDWGRSKKYRFPQ